MSEARLVLTDKLIEEDLKRAAAEQKAAARNELTRGKTHEHRHFSATGMEILQIAEAVAREKSIDKEIVIEAMEHALQKAARSRYGTEHDIRAISTRRPANDAAARDDGGG